MTDVSPETMAHRQRGEEMTPLQKRLDEHWRGYLSGDSVYSYADLIRDVKSAAEEIARLTEALAAEREACAKIADAGSDIGTRKSGFRD
jgi:hypothetical protein